MTKKTRTPVAPTVYIDACHTCEHSVDAPDDPAQILCRRFPPIPIPVQVGNDTRIFNHFPRLNRVEGHCGEYKDKVKSSS